jgi:DNA-binding transcriptional regulator LsrR (DeoR family)
MTRAQIADIYGISTTHVYRLVLEGPYAGAHPNTKLTDDQVIEIRERYESEPVSTRILAKEYGVSNVQIGRIINHKQRKDVKGG